MVSIEKGFFLKPLSLLTLALLVLVTLAPQTIEEERLNPLHLPPPKQIRVLTYNMFLRPPLVKTNASDHKEIRLALFIEKVLPNFDIIALQEVFELGSTRQARLLAAAKKQGFRYVTRSRPPKLWSIKWVDGGVLILSKYPIVESDAHIFRNGNQIDNQAAKQVLHAKIQLTESSQSLYQRVNRVEGQLRNFISEKTHSISSVGTSSSSSENLKSDSGTRREDVPPTEEQFVHVFTTHLQASYNENEGAVNSINDNARLAQVNEMAEFILSKIKGTKDLALLAGDLNINARKFQNDHLTPSSEYEYLMRTLPEIIQGRNITDLLLQRYKTHPATFGDAFLDEKTGKLVPRETVLTHSIDLCIQQCIDYAIAIQSTADTSKNFQDTRVEEFFVQNPIVTQVSDHYGISTIINVTQ